MKNNTVEQLKNIRNEIIACSINIEVVLKGLEEVSTDYQLLKDVELEFISNVNFLRSTTVIVSVREYKRALEDLEDVSKRLGLLNEQYKKLIKDYSKYKNSKEKLQIQYDKMLGKYTSTHNILTFRGKK